ncbi:condensation domain-containing protein [Streptomyces umbrinus]
MPLLTSPHSDCEHRQAEFPLTYEQDRYDFRARHFGLRKNVGISYEILGPLDRELFEQAVHAFVLRHDALQMDLLPVSNVAGQTRTQSVRPLSEGEHVLRHQQVKAASVEQFARYASVTFARDFVAPWPDAGRPFTLRLLRQAPDRHAFLATFQNLVFDGRAHHLFGREVWRDYTTLLAGEAISQTAPSFAAAALRQRTTAGPRHLARARENWRERLEFDAEHRWERIGAASDDGIVRTQLGTDAVLALREACRREHCTVMQWLVAAFARAVGRCSGRPRLSINMTMDTRGRAEQDVVGMFAGAGLLMVRDALASLPEARAEVRQQMLAALRYHQLTAEDVRRLDPSEPRPARDIFVNLRRFDEDYNSAATVGPLRAVADAYPLRGITFTNPSALHLRVDEYRDRIFVNLLFNGERVGGTLARVILRHLVADTTGGALFDGRFLGRTS